LTGFEAFRPRLERYVVSLTGYKKNRFPPLDATTRQQVANRWRRSFATWGYPTDPGDGA
jgi:hypothetical protein